MEDAIFYHEDFYRQIELIPQENHFRVHSDMNETEITNKSDYGCIKMREREENLVVTESLNINMDSIRKKLQPFTIKYFNTVSTGYSNTAKIKKNTVSLGFERIAIFFELTEKNIVRNIWLAQTI